MENVSLEQAIELLTDRVKPISDTENLPLLDALGYVLAEDVTASMDNPPFNRSPLDGYTFCSEATKGASDSEPAILDIIGEECAGDYFAEVVTGKQAVRIMTGAPIPQGCDCVIKQEIVKVDENGKLLVFCQIKHNENVCFKGEDFQKGTVLIKAGTELTAAHLGIAASMGLTHLKVYRRAKILLASTGDELVTPGENLPLGKIYNSNLYVIAGRLKEMGLSVELLGILPDDEKEAADVLRQYQGKVDVLLTTGGVSVGKKDIMHGVVKQLEAERIFWRLAMKPGSPVIAYDVNGTLGIALSGNPFAALATFELIARPVFSALTQREKLLPVKMTVTLADEFPKKSKGRRFIRARIDVVEKKAYLPDNHGSGSLSSAAGCNGMLDIPAGSDKLNAGDVAQAVILR